MAAATELVTSRYNLRIPVEGGELLYNSASGAVIRLSGPDATCLASDLAGPRIVVPEGVLPEMLYRQLTTGQFVVEPGIDEVGRIRARFWQARRETPMVITVTTTQDCNLGCYYCYEERSSDRLGGHDIASLVALAAKLLEESGKQALHVDWYGGEPLLNVAFLEPASAAIQAFCLDRGVRYTASVISNGTCWPDDSAAFVGRHKIRQVQITFDGLRDHHDRRRRYRSGRAPSAEASSFDAAAGLVDRLADRVLVDVRLNIDHGNAADAVPFVRFARDRGWFRKPFPVRLQPARIAAYTERSGFVRRRELSIEEFDRIRAAIRAEAGAGVRVEESEAPGGFPHPKTSVCAALAMSSVVIGADGRQYRCGLQVGDRHRAVGGLRPQVAIPLPLLDAEQPAERSGDAAWWAEFDPTALPTCSRCSFLPVCWAGCPKKHLDGDEHAIAEQSAYWRSNLPRLVATGVGAEVEIGFAFGDVDQFR